MGNVKRFAAVNTKIKALKGNMLTNEDYVNLLKQGSVTGVGQYLKEYTSYNEVLKGVDVSVIHRDDLELTLNKYMILILEKLLHYFEGEYKKLYKTILTRYVIEDIKLYIRALIRNEELNLIAKQTLYIKKCQNIDENQLSQSKTIDELVENLKGTPYYQALRPFLNDDKDKLIFYMEMSLDRLYFNLLYNQIQKLEKNDKKFIIEILGKNIDLLNIEWMYRGLKYYFLSPEEIINYTLEGGYDLNYRKIKDICYSRDENEFIEKILKTRYAFLFDNKDTIDLFMERRIKRYLYYELLRFYKKGKMDIIQSITYIHLLEYEIRDIVSIIEASRYKLNKNEAKKYLVRNIKGSDG